MSCIKWNKIVSLIRGISRRAIILCKLVYTAIVSLNSLDFLSGVWGGAKLADVLELVGISKLTSTTKSGGKHVEFVSIDKCKVTCHSE